MPVSPVYDILLAGIGSDSHSVGLQLLRRAIAAWGYKLKYLGIQTNASDIKTYSALSRVIMLSSLDGHAKIYLNQFPQGVHEYKSDNQYWLIGGNLGIRDNPAEIISEIQSLGFDEVFPHYVDLNTVRKTIGKYIKADTHNTLPNYKSAYRRIESTPARLAFLSDEVFYQDRENVLTSWPTGRQASSLQKAFETQSNLNIRFVDVLKSQRRKAAPILHPRCGVADVDEQLSIFKGLFSADVEVFSFQIDSLTRSNEYGAIEREIRTNNYVEKAKLNGFPLINHGVTVTNSIIKSFDTVPFQVRHSTRDPRLLAEMSLASGCTSFEGGALSYCLPYFKSQSLVTSIKNWRYVDKLCGLYEKSGFPIDREFFGTLTGTLVEPSIAISVCILETLLAAEQGCRHFSLGYAEQGNRSQDIAAIQSMKALAEHYLRLLNYSDYHVSTVFHQYMAGFPTDLKKAKSLLQGSAISSQLSGATRLMTKTLVEATEVPTVNENIEALHIIKDALNDKSKRITVDETQIALERSLIDKEAHSIVGRVLSLSEGHTDLGGAIVDAIRLGYLDVPFSPHIENAGLVITARDKNGAIRFLDTGNLPFNKEICQFHKNSLSIQKAPCHDAAIIKKIERDLTFIPHGNFSAWPLDG